MDATTLRHLLVDDLATHPTNLRDDLGDLGQLARRSRSVASSNPSPSSLSPKVATVSSLDTGA